MNGKNGQSVKIVEAISERLEVKYSIKTTTTHDDFQGNTFTVMRTHGEFEWLFSSLAENPKYWGFIIPGKPEKCDMSEIRARFGRLVEFEEMHSHDEFVREKDEVTAQYLAEFKRTVVRHELFLKRIVEHPTLCADGDLQLFLTFPGQLEVPQQSSGKLLNFFKAIYKTDDSSLLSIEDSDFFFETNKNFVLDYLPKLQDTLVAVEEVLSKQAEVASDVFRIVMSSNTLRNNERLSVISREHNFQHFLTRFERHLEFLKKIETDQMNELQQQLADALKVQESETIACKDLLIRRARAAANCAKCKRELDKATSQGKNVQQVAEVSRETNELLDLLSAEGKDEISSFADRRQLDLLSAIASLQQSQLKQTQAKIVQLEQCVLELRSIA